MAYTIIPYFVKRAGATLLNISNLTTILWSMVSDIVIFGTPFVIPFEFNCLQYWMYFCGFIVEIIAISIYSYKSPIYRKKEPEEISTNDED